MIKLYNYELSGSCYKVRLLPHFLELQYEKIPVLEDGDLVIRDAQAILTYLALEYDSSNSWYPNHPNQRGMISQWLATGGGELTCVSGARDLQRYALAPLNPGRNE